MSAWLIDLKWLSFVLEAGFGLGRYVDSWKRHQALWKTEKASVMDKFKMKHPTNADFEEKLAKYAKLADDVWRQVGCSHRQTRQEYIGQMSCVLQCMCSKPTLMNALAFTPSQRLPRLPTMSA